MGRTRSAISGVALSVLFALGACSRPADPVVAVPGRHHHHPPHMGTPIELGQDEYHVELVLDPESGMLQAYVLDSEMENFVRSSAASIAIRATVGGKEETLVLNAVANPETGETIGDTALFQAPAGWVKAAGSFDAVLSGVTIRGTPFTDVKFNFPKGNDTDG